MNAILLNKKIKRAEKQVFGALALMFWTGQGATFDEEIEIYTDDICLRTSASSATVYRALANLEAAGYITRRPRKTARGDRNLASLFTITDKTFVEYAEQYPNVIAIGG